jgi:hypothetical protein
MRLLVISLATCTLLPAVALAEAPAPPTDIRVESFDDELVDGDLVSPIGEEIRIPPRHRGRSLIRVREHFHPEMMGSVEDL